MEKKTKNWSLEEPRASYGSKFVFSDNPDNISETK